jgi:hypothetical protein
MKNGIFWILPRVTLVRTDDSEELSASFIRVTKIGELGTTVGVTNNAYVSIPRLFFSITGPTYFSVPQYTSQVIVSLTARIPFLVPEGSCHQLLQSDKMHLFKHFRLVPLLCVHPLS